MARDYRHRFHIRNVWGGGPSAAAEKDVLDRYLVLWLSGSPNLQSFQQELRELGYVERKNIALEYR